MINKNKPRGKGERSFHYHKRKMHYKRLITN
jgi:hypothetical protein